MTAARDGISHPLASGAGLCRSVLVCPQLAAWGSRVYERYREIEAARAESGPDAVTRSLAPRQRFAASASSLTIGAALSEEDLGAILTTIAASSAGEWTRAKLGSKIAVDLDQSWVRRQYAPSHYPPLHAPHGWHQDGALGFDFRSHLDGQFPETALLPMVTCWVAVDPCGFHAPGLELVTRQLKGLLPPDQLMDDRVRARFVPEEFWKPLLQPGDALLFQGDILHRTHVTSAMTRDRTSIELRFFSASNLPSRLKGDQFVVLDAARAGAG